MAPALHWEPHAVLRAAGVFDLLISRE